ncbi:hypothetical protein SAY86_010543 [Trapa natans]|uniref:AT-hook motif nuclear-localized protein n=1 Tax=Trapa natans TaxID=22666 RepID=A0AAN7R3D5_TRANT|nr:hypothetical protein SAY86_010543 [Trapa natans]
MDGREAMAISGGPAQYFMHKAGLGSASGLQPGGINATPPFRALTNAHHHHVQAGAAAAAAAQSSMGATLSGQAFEVELSPPPSHGGFSRGGISIGASSAGSPSAEHSQKRKRGRPRKYGPDGMVALGLLPTSGAAPDSTPGTITPLPNKVRGRPRGSGRKQRLATVGKYWPTPLSSWYPDYGCNVNFICLPGIMNESSFMMDMGNSFVIFRIYL